MYKLTKTGTACKGSEEKIKGVWHFDTGPEYAKHTLLDWTVESSDLLQDGKGYLFHMTITFWFIRCFLRPALHSKPLSRPRLPSLPIYNIILVAPAADESHKQVRTCRSWQLQQPAAALYLPAHQEAGSNCFISQSHGSSSQQHEIKELQGQL